jgi:hypothetical protein
MPTPLPRRTLPFVLLLLDGREPDGRRLKLRAAVGVTRRGERVASVLA